MSFSSQILDINKNNEDFISLNESPFSRDVYQNIPDNAVVSQQRKKTFSIADVLSD